MGALFPLPPAALRGARGGVAPPAAGCITCSARGVCLPSCVTESHDRLDPLVYARKRAKRDEFLYRMGSPFESLYAVRSGCVASRAAVEDGRDQVTGFHLPGDIVGMDGVATGEHAAEVYALDDVEVCIIPRRRLEETRVQQHVHKAMSRELARAQGMMLSLGTLCAEERLAAFLLGFSDRVHSLGYACNEFNLRMSRLDIGSYLGLRLETVCRILQRLRRAGLIAVNQKRIRIIDLPALSAMARAGAAR